MFHGRTLGPAKERDDYPVHPPTRPNNPQVRFDEEDGLRVRPLTRAITVTNPECAEGEGQGDKEVARALRIVFIIVVTLCDDPNIVLEERFFQCSSAPFIFTAPAVISCSLGQ